MENVCSAPRIRRLKRVRLGAVALVAGVLLGVGVPRITAHEAGVEGPVKVHVVRSGETLWSLASVYAPEEDPREFTYKIRVLNGLAESAVTPGQQLRIPQ